MSAKWSLSDLPMNGPCLQLLQQHPQGNGPAQAGCCLTLCCKARSGCLPLPEDLDLVCSLIGSLHQFDACLLSCRDLSPAAGKPSHMCQMM